MSRFQRLSIPESEGRHTPVARTVGPNSGRNRPSDFPESSGQTFRNPQPPSSGFEPDREMRSGLSIGREAGVDGEDVQIPDRGVGDEARGGSVDRVEIRNQIRQGQVLDVQDGNRRRGELGE